MDEIIMKSGRHGGTKMNISPGFEFNFRNGSFTDKRGKEVFLEARLKEFFTILAQNMNDVVTRDELMSFVWKDVVVGDDSITKAAFDLRKFLSENQIEGIRLTTIRKLGYKLESVDSEESEKVSGTGYLKLSAKIFGALVVVLMLILIGIRAINY